MDLLNKKVSTVITELMTLDYDNINTHYMNGIHYIRVSFNINDTEKIHVLLDFDKSFVETNEVLTSLRRNDEVLFISYNT